MNTNGECEGVIDDTRWWTSRAVGRLGRILPHTYYIITYIVINSFIVTKLFYPTKCSTTKISTIKKYKHNHSWSANHIIIYTWIIRETNLLSWLFDHSKIMKIVKRPNIKSPLRGLRFLASRILDFNKFDSSNNQTKIRYTSDYNDVDY